MSSTTLEVVGHNIISLGGSSAKSFFKWAGAGRPDIICLQATRRARDDFPANALLDGYEIADEHHAATSGAHAGVAVYTKSALGAIKRDVAFCKNHEDCLGRYVEVELASGLRVVSVYVPDGQSQAGSKRFDDFWVCFFDRMRELAQERAIVVGDLNTAFTHLDVVGDATGKRGMYNRERELAARLTTQYGFVDTFRKLNPVERRYSFWHSRRRSQYPDGGWRLDYQLASATVAPLLVSSEILQPEKHADLMSDHATTVASYAV